MGYELMAGSFAGFQPDPHVRYPRVASALVDLLRQWMDPVTSPFRPDVQLDFFNASYSAHADSAVMWQRYGVGGRGFVFGFDAAAIGATHPYRRALARVRYSAEQHAALQDQAASLLGRAANSIASLGGPVEVQKARNLTTLPIMSVLFGLAAVIKDWRWNDEAEWRTTLLARPRSDFVKYDERGQAEYLTQPLVGLKEVRAGPRVSDRERNEMKSMLCQAGYGSIALLDSDVDAPFAATPTP